MPMLLSNQQKEILHLLRDFGGLRLDQLKRLLLMKFPEDSIKLEPMLRQLVFGGLIRRTGQYIFLPDVQDLQPAIHNALEVMFRLSTQGIQACQKGTPPFILTFFRTREDKLYRYDVCPVSAANLPVVLAQVEGLQTKYRVIIFLLEDVGLEEACRWTNTIPCAHCYAVRTKDGIHFYKEDTKNE